MSSATEAIHSVDTLSELLDLALDDCGRISAERRAEYHRELSRQVWRELVAYREIVEEEASS